MKGITEFIKESKKKIAECHDLIAKLNKGIEAAQALCPHDENPKLWKYDGHSHNDSCYVCTVCGKEEWR